MFVFCNSHLLHVNSCFKKQPSLASALFIELYVGASKPAMTALRLITETVI